jgi:hypothetical protein
MAARRSELRGRLTARSWRQATFAIRVVTAEGEVLVAHVLRFFREFVADAPDEVGIVAQLRSAKRTVLIRCSSRIPVFPHGRSATGRIVNLGEAVNPSPRNSRHSAVTQRPHKVFAG